MSRAIIDSNRLNVIQNMGVKVYIKRSSDESLHEVKYIDKDDRVVIDDPAYPGTVLMTEPHGEDCTHQKDFYFPNSEIEKMNILLEMGVVKEELTNLEELHFQLYDQQGMGFEKGGYVVSKTYNGRVIEDIGTYKVLRVVPETEHADGVEHLSLLGFGRSGPKVICRPSMFYTRIGSRTVETPTNFLKFRGYNPEENKSGE